MSLTSQLKRGRGPAYLFFRERLPNSRKFTATLTKALRIPQPLRPTYEDVGALTSLAFDYRSKIFFGADDSVLVPARRGSNIVRLFMEEKLIYSFFQSAGKIFEKSVPGTLGEPDLEKTLLCHCVVLALFEQFYRVGDLIADSSPLTTIEHRDIHDLLKIVSGERLDDLMGLCERFHVTFSNLSWNNVVIGPSFSGSRDVGGADADLLIDGCLLDVKVSNAAHARTVWIRQQVGYALLDYENAYAINRIGFYLGRQGKILCWPLLEVVRHLAKDASVTLEGLRREFRDYLLVVPR